MKSIPTICILALFYICIASSLALDLGSFFRSYSAPKTLSEPKPSSSADLHQIHEFLEKEQTEEDVPSYSSESYSEYRSDSDFYVYNSSSEQELADLLSSNTSSEGNDTSEPASSHVNTSSNASKQTVEKSSSPHDSESTTEVQASSESSKTNEIVWNRVSTPAQASTTVGHTAAANFTTEEKEEVVLVTGEPTEAFGPKTIYQKSIDWLADEYTLSILLPVSAGVVFAITIICTIAMCRCVRRCCRRRRFRKKCLPDSVKSLKASDRARLLGDFSSDEEF